HGELASVRNLYVIINLQRHFDAVAFANHARAASDFSNSRAGEQNIGPFQKAARIGKSDRERIISFEAFTQPTELHDQRAEHRQADKDKCGDFEFQTSLAPIHLEILLSNLSSVFATGK